MVFMAFRTRKVSVAAAVSFAVACGVFSCGTNARFSDAGPLASGKDATSSTSDSGSLGGSDASTTCPAQCTLDYRDVVDCHGNIVSKCGEGEACDPTTMHCKNACDVASSNKQSVGCDYYSVLLKQQSEGRCFAAIISNTWKSAAKLNVDFDGVSLDASKFAWHPQGTGPSLTYTPYDPSVGIKPGDVAILFLSGSTGSTNAQCPKVSAVPTGAVKSGTTKGSGFRIRTDVPVVAYQINPYGGGAAAVTGSSLLLPTSAWSTNYIAANAAGGTTAGNPTLNIIAHQDNTTVEMLPVNAIVGGSTGLPAGAKGVKYTFSLNAGQHAQFIQPNELTGSVVKSDKPVGLFAGHECMNIPSGVFYCDHGEQMIPPVQAMGSEYVGVMYRPRKSEPAIWRMIGAEPGTQLTWSNAVGGPATLGAGQVVEFQTAEPFVVKSQDSSHPFLLLTYMSGSDWRADMNGYGDPDVVLSVPPQQYLSRYVFFVDPTYPEGNLVVVRKKDSQGNFADVELDCAGKLTGWQPVGDYEWTRADLITGAFKDVGSCSSGRHEMTSKQPFGLWVWGWGTPLTDTFTKNVSYGYPAGMNLQPINQVVIEPVPR